MGKNSAANDLTTFSGRNSLSTTQILPYASVMQTILQRPHGTIVDADNQPVLYDIFLHSSHSLIKQYGIERDISRTNRLRDLDIINTDPQHWENVSLRLAHDMATKIVSSSRRYQLTRLIYDWHETGANLFKREYDTQVATCKLCNAPLEDQQHILLYCTHSRMQQIRDHHLSQIRITLPLQKSTPMQRFIHALHHLIMQPQHFSLMLGRVHDAQRLAIQQLPNITTSPHAAYKEVVKHLRRFLAMALHLTSERIALLGELKADLTKSSVTRQIQRRHQTSIERAFNEVNEAVVGIEPHNTLHSDGTLVTSKNYDASTVIRASQRATLTSENSIFIRNLLTRSRSKQIAADAPPLMRSINTALRDNSQSKSHRALRRQSLYKQSSHTLPTTLPITSLYWRVNNVAASKRKAYTNSRCSEQLCNNVASTDEVTANHDNNSHNDSNDNNTYNSNDNNTDADNNNNNNNNTDNHRHSDNNKIARIHSNTTHRKPQRLIQRRSLYRLSSHTSPNATLITSFYRQNNKLVINANHNNNTDNNNTNANNNSTTHRNNSTPNHLINHSYNTSNTNNINNNHTATNNTLNDNDENDHLCSNTINNYMTANIIQPDVINNSINNSITSDSTTNFRRRSLYNLSFHNSTHTNNTNRNTNNTNNNKNTSNNTNNSNNNTNNNNTTNTNSIITTNCNNNTSYHHINNSYNARDLNSTINNHTATNNYADTTTANNTLNNNNNNNYSCLNTIHNYITDNINQTDVINTSSNSPNMYDGNISNNNNNNNTHAASANTRQHTPSLSTFRWLSDLGCHTCPLSPPPHLQLVFLQ